MSQKQITQQQYSDARGYSYGVALDVGLSAACVYQQLIFWSNASKKDWFYKSAVDLATELPISKATIDRSITELKNAGYIEVKLKKANGAATRHIRVYSKCVNGFTQNDQTYRFTQNDETHNNKETINNNNKDNGGVASNKNKLGLATDSTSTRAASDAQSAESTGSLQDSAKGALSPNLEQIVDVAKPNQETGDLTNQLGSVVTKLKEIFSTDVDKTLVQQALTETDVTTLTRTARWFSKQALESEDQFWAERRHWNNSSIFLTPNSKGTKYYVYYAERAMAAPKYNEDMTSTEKMFGSSKIKKAMF